MIVISPVRTKRINATLNELSLRSAIYLCKLSPDQHEHGTSKLLESVVAAVPAPLPAQVVDPKLWTVQERAFVAAHYMAHVIEGGPDFAIGRNGKYSDYLLSGEDACPESIELGIVGGQCWFMRPLLGGFAESVERLILRDELPNDREGWLIGAMACQLFNDDKPAFSLVGAMDSAVDDYVTESALALMAMPESDAISLLELFMDGMEKLDHIFRLQIGDDGVRFLPVSMEVPDLLPARFPFSSAVRRETQLTFGEPDGGGSGADAVLRSADVERDVDDALGCEGDLRVHGVYELEEGEGPRP